MILLGQAITNQFLLKYKPPSVASRVIYALASLLLLFQATPGSASSYIKCWTNNAGLTECGNRIPREHYSKEVRFIDPQGITRKVKERKKTAAELAMDQENQRALNAELERKKKLKEYDEILLKTYLTVDDLISALNSKLEILESRITVLESIINTREKQFNDLVRQAADVERAGKQLSKRLNERLQVARTELRNLHSQLESERQESLKIQETYTHDVERFMVTSTVRILYGLENPKIARKFNAIRLGCSSNQQCQRYWDKANKYVNHYATTPVRYSNNSIVVTDSPAKPEDIAMGLTYLEKDELFENKDDNFIVLQLRCHQGRQGQDHCQGDNVSNILRDFKSEMYY